MSPQAYEYLLVAANLAHFHTKWGFSVKKRKWGLFIEGHRFSSRHCMGIFEIDSKTIDLNSFINGMSPVHRVRRQFIRIGIINDYSPRKIEMQKYSDGRLIVTPPRLNGLRIKQHSFRKLMEPFVWNYILEKDLDEEDDLLSAKMIAIYLTPLVMMMDSLILPTH
jgi:hypothetical protein